LVEQWITGTQAMPEIVSFEAWAGGVLALEAALVELPPVDLLGEEPEGALPLGATAPPGDAAEPKEGCASARAITQHARIAVLAAIEVDRLWTSALATNIPSVPPGLGPCSTRLAALRADTGGPATLDVSGYGFPNRW
jgi:hypothetical protein